MDTTTLVLAEPISAHGKDITTLAFRKPNGAHHPPLRRADQDPARRKRREAA